MKPSFTRPNRKRQVAFYGGSFTAMNGADQVRYLKEVQPFLSSGLIDSIRISTRPDALSEEIFPLLKKYGVRTVEVGAQSMIDQVLTSSNRGHSAEDTVSAASRLRNWGFEVGIHLMIGLPGDTFDRFLRTLDQIIDLKPDFVRIHPTLVLKGAPLEILWRAKKYSPLSLDEAIGWLKKGVLKLEGSSIPLARVGLQATKELEDHYLAGPYHSALHQLVDSAIAFDMATHLLRASSREPRVLFFCHPREISNLRGQRNGNTWRLKDQFGLMEILIESKEDMLRGSLVLQTSKEKLLIKRADFRYDETVAMV